MFHETGEMPKGAMYVHQSSDMECSSYKVKYESLYERTKLINKIILIRMYVRRRNTYIHKYKCFVRVYYFICVRNNHKQT